MGVIQTLKVINQMQADGVIGSYAVVGAFAASYYTEPTSTEDVDILVSFETEAGGRQSGDSRKEGMVVGGWPVQFLPAADDLDAEALAQAKEIDINEAGGPVRTRVLSAEHVAAIFLRAGGAKNFTRIAQLLEADVLDVALLNEILGAAGEGRAAPPAKMRLAPMARSAVRDLHACYAFSRTRMKPKSLPAAAPRPAMMPLAWFRCIPATS